MTETASNVYQIDMTTEAFGEVEKLYRKAIQGNAKMFEYRGNTVLVAYAKYLLTYMAMSLRKEFIP